jgi:4-hydroxy-tetrahydrodipicolinate synthase
LGMDHVGRYGGPTRLPRLPLPKHEQEQIHREMDVALAYFKNR